MKFWMFATIFIVINIGLAVGINWLWTSDLQGEWRLKAMLLMTPPLFSALCIMETVLMDLLLTLAAHAPTKGK